MSEYDTNPKVKKLVDGIEWYIIPVVNVDGYDYTWTNDRLWLVISLILISHKHLGVRTSERIKAHHVME